MSTGVFPFGGVLVALSRATTFSSAPSFRTSSTGVLVLEKSPPAPATRAVTVVWSVLTTQWPKYWLWSSMNAKTIGMRSCRTWSSPAAIRLAPPLPWLPRLALLLFSTALGSLAYQSLARDQLAYCELASERTTARNDIFNIFILTTSGYIVRKMQALTVSRVERRNSALSDALCRGSQLRCG